MAYKILSERERQHPTRPGLEGPFFYPSGAVLYYDPREGQYWDPTTDYYVPADEVSGLKEQLFCKLRG